MMEDQNASWLQEWIEKLKHQKSKTPFPSSIDQDHVEASTEFFARSRIPFPRETERNQTAAPYNPILPYFVKEYPLPIGREAIAEAYYRNEWNENPAEIMPQPLIEYPRDGYAGLAILRETEHARGWFIGLVKLHTAYTMDNRDFEGLSEAEKWTAVFDPDYQFIEGMFLIEGQLEEELISQLKDVQKSYNEKVLGKIIQGKASRGRPAHSSVYTDEEFMRLSTDALRKFSRRPLQDEMAELLRLDARTYKNYRRRLGFKSYENLITYLYTRI